VLKKFTKQKKAKKWRVLTL